MTTSGCPAFFTNWATREESLLGVFTIFTKCSMLHKMEPPSGIQPEHLTYRVRGLALTYSDKIWGPDSLLSDGQRLAGVNPARSPIWLEQVSNPACAHIRPRLTCKYSLTGKWSFCSASNRVPDVTSVVLFPLSYRSVRYHIQYFCPLTGLNWSGRWDFNPRSQPWRGCAVALSYARMAPSLRVERSSNGSKPFRKPLA